MKKKSYKYNFLCISYLGITVILFLYSYTQVDLGLTLSGYGFLNSLQRLFQQVGFFMRPVSTIIYTVLMISYFGLYLQVIYMVKKKEMDLRKLWKIILLITPLMILSYPAFSYDIFNYMFTAKTVLVYGKNPYLVKPLDFTGIEPWLAFMRWTHLPSAYTPVWIILSLIPFWFGFKFFLLILWNMKIMIYIFYLFSVWSIVKIQQHTDQENTVLTTAVYALNPLVLIESVISPHNDTVMVSLALAAVYLYFKRNIFLAYILLALSVSVKTMTLFLYPFFLKWNNKKTMFVMMLLAYVTGTIIKEPLPWYFLWVIPFASLMPGDNMIVFITGMTAGLVFSYAPYIYFGDYSGTMRTYRNIVTIFPMVISFLLVAFSKLKHSRHNIQAW